MNLASFITSLDLIDSQNQVILFYFKAYLQLVK